MGAPCPPSSLSEGKRKLQLSSYGASFRVSCFFFVIFYYDLDELILIQAQTITTVTWGPQNWYRKF